MVEELERATQPIKHEMFRQLMRLTLMHRWLEPESKALTDLWNLCKKEREQNLLFDLIARFKYLNSSQLKENGEIIAEHIVNEWKFQPKGTRIVAISDNRNADGSLMFLQSLKNKFSDYGWSERNFINSIGEGARLTQNNYNIILIDDFIGSGKTIERRYNWFLGKINEKNKKGVKIKVVALAALEMSKEKLDGLGIDYYVPIWLNKGISDNYNGKQLTTAINDMLSLEKLLENKYMGLYLPSLGYDKSEALFSIESFNVPNNVFPIFWWPVLKGTIKRNTLFKRIR